MSDSETRPLHVVVDTNYLLRGTALEQTTPKMLGLKGSISSWVFVRTVVKELDDKTHHTNSRLRNRASNALKYLSDGPIGPERGAGAPVTLFYPYTPIVYNDLGFDPFDNDDKIRAEIVAYSTENPDTDVVLLTLDRGMRIQAKLHQINVLDPTVDLRVADDEDPLVAENRSLRKQLDDRQGAEPKLNLSFGNGALEFKCRTFPAFDDEISEIILDQVSQPDNDDNAMRRALVGLHVGGIKENPSYAAQLERYRAELRAKLPHLWTFMGLSVSIELTLANQGDVQADNVGAFITLPEFTQSVEEPANAPDLPEKPDAYLPTEDTVFAKAMRANTQHVWGFGGLIPPIQTRPVAPSASGPDLQSDGSVKYWQRSIPQQRSIALRKLHLELQKVPDAVRLAYDISAANITGRHSGHVILRTVVKNRESAIDAVTREIFCSSLNLNGKHKRKRK